MRYKTHILINSLLLTIVFSTFSILSTANGNEEQAKKLFADKNYTEALPLYQELNAMYPNDAIFQFGLGVCLTETEQYGQKAKKLLLQASLSEVSPTVYFYIGKNYHAIDNFEIAKKYYTRFAENSKKKIKKKLNYNSIVLDCYEGINPFVVKTTNNEFEIPIETITIDTLSKLNKEIVIDSTEIDTIQTEEIVIEKYEIPETSQISDSSVVVGQTDTIIPTEPIDETIQITEATEPIFQIPTELRDTVFSFILSSSVEYLTINQFKTSEGKTEFINGWTEQKMLTELLLKIEELRTAYAKSINDIEKASIAEKVLNLELILPDKKAKSDQSFSKARENEMIFWNNAIEEDFNKLKIQNDSIKTLSINKIQIEKTINLEDTIKITNKSDTLTTKEINPIQLEKEEEIESLVYRIQIGAYSKGLPEYVDKLYQKLSAFRKINKYTDDHGIVVYTVGEISNLEDAIKLQKQIRQEGVKDAFVVAYNNRKRITLSEAKEITNND